MVDTMINNILFILKFKINTINKNLTRNDILDKLYNIKYFTKFIFIYFHIILLSLNKYKEIINSKK